MEPQDTPHYQDVKSMLANPPKSWEKVYSRYQITDPSPENIVLIVLDFTPSLADAGPPGECQHFVPDPVQDAAFLGLRLSHQHRYSSTSGIGLARSVQLSLAPVIWERSVRRMAAYFLRHRRDTESARFGDPDKPSKGYMAWLNWGGYPGWEWSRNELRLIDAQPSHGIVQVAS